MSQTAPTPVTGLTITLRQAEKLLRFFGGHDCEVTVAARPDDWAGQPDGLYAYCTEYPAEGTQYLGATEVDDELSRIGRARAVPLPADQSEARPDLTYQYALKDDCTVWGDLTAVDYEIALRRGDTVRIMQKAPISAKRQQAADAFFEPIDAALGREANSPTISLPAGPSDTGPGRIEDGLIAWRQHAATLKSRYDTYNNQTMFLAGWNAKPAFQLASIAAAPSLPVAVQQPTAMHAAADFIDAKARKYLTDHAETEHDTGATVFHYGEAGRDYHSGLVELAEEIRALPVAERPTDTIAQNAELVLRLLQSLQAESLPGNWGDLVEQAMPCALAIVKAAAGVPLAARQEPRP